MHVQACGTQNVTVLAGGKMDISIYLCLFLKYESMASIPTTACHEVLLKYFDPDDMQLTWSLNYTAKRVKCSAGGG